LQIEKDEKFHEFVKAKGLLHDAKEHLEDIEKNTTEMTTSEKLEYAKWILRNEDNGNLKQSNILVSVLKTHERVEQLWASMKWLEKAILEIFMRLSYIQDKTLTATRRRPPHGGDGDDADDGEDGGDGGDGGGGGRRRQSQPGPSGSSQEESCFLASATVPMTDAEMLASVNKLLPCENLQ
jgi:hypothetical protein